MLKPIFILFFLMGATTTFGQNVAFCDSNDRMQVVNYSGLSTECEYIEISGFEEGICWVNKGELYGFMDSSLHAITDFVYTQVSSFKNGYASVSRDSIFGFINRNGDEICALKYEGVRDFKHNLAPVMLNDKWGLLDTTGQLTLPADYDYPPIIDKKSFILVCVNSKWGVLNSSLEIIYPIMFDLITVDGKAFELTKMVLLGAR